MFKSLDNGLSCTSETIEKKGFTDSQFRVIFGAVQEQTITKKEVEETWMRTGNSYPVRTISRGYITDAGLRDAWWIPEIPNYVWLAMIILAVSALSISTLMRSQAQEREAKASYTSVKTRLENAKGINRQIKEQTQRIKNNPEVAAQAAQDELRLLRPNEIVVAVP
jgi:cell division protein FtsB